MIQSKVDSRFLGSVKNSFFVFPTLPPLVKMFLWFIALGVAISIIILLWRKYKPISFLQAWFKSFPPLRVIILRSKKGGEAVTEEGKSPAVKGPWKISTDKDVLDWLVMTKQPFDISAERLGQRTLAAVVNVTGIQGRDIAVKVKDVVTESLLAPGAKVKCIFAELQRNGKKVNAFVGSVKTVSESGEAVVTRTSAFGFIKRRAYSRRKVADQRYIKVKIWRLDGDDFDVDFILDNMEPEIIIDNRMDVDAELKVPQILDISKGGVALLGAVRDGGNMLSRNDNVLLCMLIYQPKRKTFDPHILYCEVRAAKSASEGLIRLSFQFLRSLKIPPRKRSTLFRGQAVMAMNLAQPEKEQ